MESPTMDYTMDSTSPSPGSSSHSTASTTHRNRRRSNPFHGSPSSIPSLRPLSLLTLSLSLLPSSYATTAPSSLPQIDFSRMGSVGFIGSFSGLDFFQPATNSSSTPIAYSSTQDSLVLLSAPGQGSVLGQTDAGGSITSSCYSSSTSTLYLGGSFTTFSSLPSRNIISYSPTTSLFSPLSLPTTQGIVETLYCDDLRGQVWVGGAGGKGVVVMDMATKAFSAVPFVGVNGTVRTITPGSSGSGTSLLFGGDFITSLSSSRNTSTNSTTSSNSTSDPRTTSVPSSPPGTLSTGVSGYLTPLSIPSASTEITASPPSTGSYADPSVLACPASGQGWEAQDGVNAKVGVVLDGVGGGGVGVRGVRVGNFLEGGRGTTTFSLVTIPDNTLQTLTYTDPSTGLTATCTSSCPLSTNSSITAQDFLFPSTQSITGIQLTLLTFQGSGAALSRLQLLSDGAGLSAVQGENSKLCYGNGLVGNSEVQTAGTWSERTVTTDIPGAVLDVLTSSVSTSSQDRPGVTYYPFIASSGQYDVYLDIPGCTQMQDCGSRTSVDVEVFPSSGSLGFTSTISQTVTSDTDTLIYSGWIEATTSSFQATISMGLAKSPSQPSGGGNWGVVAGRVGLSFTGIGGFRNGTTGGQAGANGSTQNSTGSVGSMAGGNSTSTSVSRGFGVFEWIAGDASDASGILANSSQTGLDKAGVALSAALGTSPAAGSTVETLATVSGITYIGGLFQQTGNYSNVLSVASNGTVRVLPNGGLDGKVATSVVVGDYVYFGGAFKGTTDGGVKSQGVMRYDPNSRTWVGLGLGVDGVVTGLTAGRGNGSILVSGNFSNALVDSSNTVSTGGFAIWNITSSGGSWDTASGVVFGSVGGGSVLQNPTQGDGPVFLAGKILGMSGNGAQGFAMLSGSGSKVTIESVAVGFGSTGSGTSASAATGTSSTAAIASATGGTRRSVATKSNQLSKKQLSTFNPRKWVSIISSALRRQTTSTTSTPPAIPRSPTTAPAVLAGAFWTNSSASGSPSITILGGNFSKTSPRIGGLSFFNSGSKTLTGPNGSSAINGVVRSLSVVDNTLFVGGSLTMGSMAGLAAYDLKGGNWVAGGMPSLVASTGNVTVNVMERRANSNALIVAGSFTAAGSLGCVGVCQWDTTDARWSTLGTGLRAGEVRTMDFAGSNVLIVGGSFSLTDNSLAYAAVYSFENATWTALGSPGTGQGQLPGPVTALAVDNGNASSIFASGISTVDQSSYLMRWDGTTWTTQNNTLQSGSSVNQLVFVPLASGHSATGAIEQDRMLMVSGALSLQSTGNASAALYDGQQWHPYLTSLSSTGGAGSASALFYSQQSFSFSASHFLAVGIIVLIAIAISTGLIFLIVLIGVLWALWKRPSDDRAGAAAVKRHSLQQPQDNSETDSVHQSRLEAIQRAMFGPVLVSTGKKHNSQDSMYADFDDATIGSPGFSAAGQQTEDTHADSGAPSHLGRPTTARYKFDAQDEHELSMAEGDKLMILDESESEDWWLVRNAEGREGVVPAAYLWQ